MTDHDADLAAKAPAARVLATAWKDRIGLDWSYPVGAAAVSGALADVPQFARLFLRFQGAAQGVLQGRFPIGVAEAAYRQQGASVFRKRDDPRVGQASWTITVRAVPRPLRHPIHRLLVAGGLEVLRGWLVDNRRHEGQEGAAWVSLVYDDLDERLVATRGAKLLPRRTP